MKKALNLFIILDGSGAIVNDDNGLPLYFRHRVDAKAKKWEIGNDSYTIGYGPDHWKYKGDTK